MNQPGDTAADLPGLLLADASGRLPRADARRNAERLVSAARVAVAEVGVGVSAHEIARRAGVGVGTFYRRVPSLEALLRAVLDEVLDDLLAAADRSLEDPDAWAGFAAFATAYVALRTESCGIAEALGGACGDALADRLSGLGDRLRRLVERAQEAGVVRPDVPWQDVPFLLAAASTNARTLGLRPSDRQWERNLRITLDGLRARQAGPLPGPLPGKAPEAESRATTG
ncbi:TetR/AcrR family transcriptional regulator [Streptomyces eurocidicus]|uniref:AcrR family transcriptional regulator n=1 Tax=Streptomyces eurocidicus TaxID=66423 RepID=A0A7W8B7W9_STREU|nr:TetR/AcrR family transcriptional regulator [Streptomyces eurocidicus]MBB5117998.1 AcrR family transcriptional regulator [Streptomyces eurocidicus]MBF6053977.1 TetR family transcriptional regulator [Streptomyces eurocidicus]